MNAKKTGELIAKLRKEKCMSQNDLAERLGVTNKAISRWETGRGYPDIEMLPKLAKEFGISIQELLDGEMMPQNPVINDSDRSLEYVCMYAGQQQKKQSKKISILSTLAIILLLAVLSMFVLRYLVGYYYWVVGSDSCIVAADYSSLTFRGNRYIPLPMNGYECNVGERIVYEAQVEGVGFLGKLLFGDSLYEVKGVLNNELLYLRTDTDYILSDYYVLESKYEKYYQMLTEGCYSHYYTAVWLDDGYTLELQMADDPATVISDISNMQLVDRSDIHSLRESFRVCIYEENHLFYRWAGDVIKCEDVFYWSPSVYSEDWYGEYNMSHLYYRILDKYADELNRYYLYLCG